MHQTGGAEGSNKGLAMVSLGVRNRQKMLLWIFAVFKLNVLVLPMLLSVKYLGGLS